MSNYEVINKLFWCLFYDFIAISNHFFLIIWEENLYKQIEIPYLYEVLLSVPFDFIPGQIWYSAQVHVSTPLGLSPFSVAIVFSEQPSYISSIL